MSTFQHQVQMLWGSLPVLDYLLPPHPDISIRNYQLPLFGRKTCFGEVQKVSFPGESLQVPFAQVSPVQICPYMEESLDMSKNASVCTLKYNIF